MAYRFEQTDYGTKWIIQRYQKYCPLQTEIWNSLCLCAAYRVFKMEVAEFGVFEEKCLRCRQNESNENI